jgi:hypothetical protein
MSEYKSNDFLWMKNKLLLNFNQINLNDPPKDLSSFNIKSKLFNDAAIVNDICKYGYGSLMLPDKSSYLKTEDSSTLTINEFNFCCEFFIKTTDIYKGNIVSNLTESSDNIWSVIIDNGVISVKWFNDVVIKDNERKINDGRWHAVAITGIKKQTVLSLYIDGVLIESVNVDYEPLTDKSKIVIGCVNPEKRNGVKAHIDSLRYTNDSRYGSYTTTPDDSHPASHYVVTDFPSGNYVLMDEPTLMDILINWLRARGVITSPKITIDDLLYKKAGMIDSKTAFIIIDGNPDRRCKGQFFIRLSMIDLSELHTELGIVDAKVEPFTFNHTVINGKLLKTSEKARKLFMQRLMLYGLEMIFDKNDDKYPGYSGFVFSPVGDFNYLYQNTAKLYIKDE